jgi:hypothetical protein
LLLYFYHSSLPWYEFLSEKKKTPIEALCRGFPNEFAIYLIYARSLKISDEPDYSHLRRTFHDLFVREGYQYDDVFDWVIYKSRMNKGQSLNFRHTPQESISQEELRLEIHNSTEEISKLEATCGNRYKELSAIRLTTNPAERLDFSASEWKSFRELHQQLLGIYLDFFRCSYHPSATEDLRSIAQQRNMPGKLLKFGIHSFLDIARYQLPESLEHMLSYINYAYKSLQTLLEGVSVYRDIWLEGTRQLAWYMLFEITESRFELMLNPRYKTSFQVTNYDRHSELEIFQYRNAAAVTQISSLQNASKTAPYTPIGQQSIQIREGDRLKLLPNEILGEIFSQLSRKDLLVCRFLHRDYQIVIDSLPVYQHIWQWQIRLCVLTSKDFSGIREWEPELVKLARREMRSPGWKILLEMVERKRASVDILQKNVELSVQGKLG